MKMSDYIETRPEAIEAIHGSIAKWNLACMGCSKDINCPLCDLYGQGKTNCPDCPLELKYSVGCNDDGSQFDNYWKNYPDRITALEAMLEALVQLLPPEERVRYGDTP